jgi:hypothetical protein
MDGSTTSMLPPRRGKKIRRQEKPGRDCSMQSKHPPRPNSLRGKSRRALVKSSHVPSRQVRVGCSPTRGIDPNAAWIPAPVRATAPRQSNTSRGGGERRGDACEGRLEEFVGCGVVVWLACASVESGWRGRAGSGFGSGGGWRALLLLLVTWRGEASAVKRGRRDMREAWPCGATLLRARTGPGLILGPGPSPTCR